MSIKLKFEAEGRQAVRDTERMKDRAERSIKDLRRTTEIQGEKMERQWGEVNRKIKTLSPTLKIVGAAIGAMAVAGIYAVGRFSSKALEAFGKQEMAEKKLESALGGVNQSLLDQASALQKVTMFGDETIIEAQALIGAFVKDESAIKAATVATLDLAAAKGFDLVAAADLVSKTLGSSTNALTRYGIEVTGAVGSTERLTSLTENIAAVFGGQAAAQTETYTGAMTQLSNEFSDFMEDIGERLVPIMIHRLIPAMRDIVSDMTDWIEHNEALINQDLASIVDAIADSIRGIGSAVLWLREAWEWLDDEFRTTKEIIDDYIPTMEEMANQTNITLGAVRGWQTSVRGLTKPVGKIRSDFTVIAVDAKKTELNFRGMTQYAQAIGPPISLMTKESAKFEINMRSVENIFANTENLAQKLLRALIEAVIQTQILSKLKVGGIFSSFLGFLFHGGGEISPMLPQIPAFAPPGTKRYHGGGVPLGPQERSIVVNVGEGILNQLGMNTIGGRQGLAAANSGLPPGGGITINQYITGNVMTEEFAMEQIIPATNRAVRLGQEVLSSDSRRAERLAS